MPMAVGEENSDKETKVLNWFANFLESKPGILFGWGFIFLLLLALLIEITA